MTFSERLRLIKEYKEWLKKINTENDFAVDDNPMVFLVFLQERGLLKNKEDEKRNGKKDDKS
jgi:hypothetical protein